MHTNPMELARARMALHYAVDNYLFDRARKVNLIDISRYQKDGQVDERLAIRFHVDEKIPDTQLEAMGREPLQTQPILDIPTMVIEGKYQPQQWSLWGGGWRRRSADPHTNRADPLRGGLSISTEYSGSGTLGGVVRDRSTRREMILSNWHVLVTYWGAPRGQRILQPGRNDGGTSADVIATLERDAMSHNLDAAVAVLTGNRGLSGEQLDIGAVRGSGRAELGVEVEKSGRSSGRTYGLVTGVEGVQRLRFSGIERLIRNVVTITPRGSVAEVSRKGDSGSWWLDSTTRAVIGLHFAGSNEPERALALDVQAVLDALNVDIFT